MCIQPTKIASTCASYEQSDVADLRLEAGEEKRALALTIGPRLPGLSSARGRIVSRLLSFRAPLPAPSAHPLRKCERLYTYVHGCPLRPDFDDLRPIHGMFFFSSVGGFFFNVMRWSILETAPRGFCVIGGVKIRRAL